MANLNHSLSYLRARALIAGDLFREGRITRVEMFRIEMDVILGENSGPIRYEANRDFVDGLM